MKINVTIVFCMLSPVLATNNTGNVKILAPVPRQQWTVTFVGPDNEGTLVQIKSVHSNKCVDNKQDSAADFNPILQYDCYNNDQQKWVVVQKGRHYSLRNVNTRKCIGIEYGSTSQGAKLIQISCNGQWDQDWHYENGYLINRNSGQCMENYGSMDNNFQLLQYNCW